MSETESVGVPLPPTPAAIEYREKPPFSPQRFRSVFVLLLVLVISGLLLAVCWPFLKPLTMAALLTGLCIAPFQWLERRFRGRRSLAAAAMVVLLLLIILGPLAGLVGVVVKQAVDVSEKALPWAKQNMGLAADFDANAWLVAKVPALKDYIPSQEELMAKAGSLAQATGAYLAGSAQRITAATATMLLDLFVMLYAMFFFLRDGHSMMRKILYYVPLKSADEELMLERLNSVTRATIKGTLLIGLLQGVLAGLGFWVAGIGSAAFWGTVMVVLSVIPGIGAALVWIPGVIYLFLTGHALAATLLAAWCAVVVGTIDNVLRPILVGQDAKMPDLLILIGTLGGIFLFGPIGFILGPIVCGLFLTVWSIYGRTFREVLPTLTPMGVAKSD